MAIWTSLIFTTALIWFAVFLTCFMPVKKESNEISSPELVQDETGAIVPGLSPLKRHYNKTVLILIDALRADFVYNPNTPMVMTKRLMSQNLAFVAKAHTPTVTLPRIKALMTGSVPGFVDVVLNFGSTKYEGDSILAQMSQARRRVVFYGDDTWIKLFSDHFTRYEGTTSFFVTDYTEVDNNVTRHLPTEMLEGDFDLLILHYLGLDHIGHMAGPHSPLIPPKLQEMDQVVDTVYRALTEMQGEGLPNLLIVCGDHGMSEQGSHGGASYSETRVPLLFLSTHNMSGTGGNHMQEVDQIDLVPTLSELLGLPVPRNNLGQLLPEVIMDQGPEDQLAALLRNALQLLNLLTDNQQENQKVSELFHSACELHTKWLSLKEKDDALAKIIQNKYAEIIAMTTSSITAKLTTYDMPALRTCVLGLWMTTFLLILSKQSCVRGLVLLHVASTSYLVNHLINSQVQGQFLDPGFLIALTCLILVVFSTAFKSRALIINVFLRMRAWRCDGGTLCGNFLVTGTLLHTLSLLSSSYVEEEHQTWYFLSTSIHILHLISQLRSSDPNLLGVLPPSNSISPSNFLMRARLRCEDNTVQNCAPTDQIRQRVGATLALLLSARLSRSWNQTGNKWLHIPDIGDWLILADNRTFLSVLVALSLLFILVIRSEHLNWLQTSVATIGLFCVFWCRASAGALSLPLIPHIDRGIFPARLSFLCVLILLVSGFLPWGAHQTDNSGTDLCLTAWTVLHVLLMRPHNIVLVALMTFQQSVLSRSKLVLTPSATAVYYMWIGRTAFFSQGNSNSIATVDVGAGYVGQQDYNAVLVAILLSLATFAGPIYWFMAFLTKLNTFQPSKRDLHAVYFTVAVTCLLPVVIYVAFVVMERYHLFVWTVFLPKLLYMGLDLVIYHFLSLMLVLKCMVSK